MEGRDWKGSELVCGYVLITNEGDVAESTLQENISMEFRAFRPESVDAVCACVFKCCLSLGAAEATYIGFPLKNKQFVLTARLGWVINNLTASDEIGNFAFSPRVTQAGKTQEVR